MRARILAALLFAAPATAANAQDYQAHPQPAPSPGTLLPPASPNGTDWLNSMLGLPAPFLDSSGNVNSTFLGKGLSGYLPLTGGTITGPVSGGYYMPTCYTLAQLRALPTPEGVAFACYYDTNNSNEANIAVYALGRWRYLVLGNPVV